MSVERLESFVASLSVVSLDGTLRPFVPTETQRAFLAERPALTWQLRSRPLSPSTIEASAFWNYGTAPQKYALDGVSAEGIAAIAEAEGLLDCVPVVDMVDVISKIEWPDR